MRLWIVEDTRPLDPVVVGVYSTEVKARQAISDYISPDGPASVSDFDVSIILKDGPIMPWGEGR